MNNYDHIISLIVRGQGGYRERAIWQGKHIVEQSETWNDEHKVLDILVEEPEEDGYRSGFQIDLVTRSIVE